MHLLSAHADAGSRHSHCDRDGRRSATAGGIYADGRTGADSGAHGHAGPGADRHAKPGTYAFTAARADPGADCDFGAGADRHAAASDGYAYPDAYSRSHANHGADSDFDSRAHGHGSADAHFHRSSHGRSNG